MGCQIDFPDPTSVRGLYTLQIVMGAPYISIIPKGSWVKFAQEKMKLKVTGSPNQQLEWGKPGLPILESFSVLASGHNASTSQVYLLSAMFGSRKVQRKEKKC